MEILGIGPGEFLLIAVVLLVAVGPERLPTLARQAGRLLVRGRNWLQSSPDAALILRARQEIDQELATLRSSLLEVQNVRDEVLGAVKQAESATSSLVSGRIDLNDIGSLKPPAAAATAAASDAAAATVASDTPAPAVASEGDAALATEVPIAPETPTVEPVAPALPQVSLDPQSVARRQPRIGRAAEPAPATGDHASENGAAAAAAAAMLESIELRLQAIMSDMFALQEQLKQHGALAGDWRPPSWDMRLPGEASADASAPIETGDTSA
jgi:sec-independent protein translocase protein TatB